MKQIILFLYQVSIVCCSITIGINIGIFQRYRNKVVGFFILFQFSLLGFLVAFVLRQYFGLMEIYTPFSHFIYIIIRDCAFLLFLNAAPRFYHSLFGSQMRNPTRIFCAGSVFFACVLGILDIVFPDMLFVVFVFIFLCCGMILYGLVFCLVNFSNIGDAYLRQAIRVFAVITALFCAVLPVDILIEYLKELQFLRFLNNLPQASYVFTVSILFIPFAAKYFNHEPYRIRNRLTEYFRKKYRLTEREFEITGLLVTGKSTKEIAYAVGISKRTVDNHIYNIFKKCGIQSRIQLNQIINSNTSDTVKEIQPAVEHVSL